MIKLLAVCILPFLCTAHVAQHRARSGVDCAKVTSQFTGERGTKDQDKFVSGFPVKKQRAVLECLGANDGR